MMTLVLAWTGISLRLQVHKPTTLKKKAKLVSKLSGKVLGEVAFDLSDVSRSAVNNASRAYFVLRDVQVQAYKLMPHEWRGHEDIMLFVGQECLVPPDLAFRDFLTQEEADKVINFLDTAEQVDMLWDNDAWATQVVEALPQGFVKTNKTSLALVYHDMHLECPLEVVAFGNKRNITSVTCSSPIVFARKDLGFLRRLEQAKKLCLSSVVPTDWACCANIVHIAIYHADIPEGISCLANLRALFCYGVSSFPADFDKLKVLVLHANGCLIDLEVVANMTSLNMLEVSNLQSNNTCIPAKLGGLVNLEELVLRNNNFVGNLPSQLGNLARLKSLVVVEKNSLDLTCPDKVLELGLAKLQLSRD